MSKSWRTAPEAPLLRKPQYELTLEEELAEMATDIYIVVAEWLPAGSDFELSEDLSYHRTEHGAWVTLRNVAEGQGVELKAGETSFEKDGDGDILERQMWYITPATLED